MIKHKNGALARRLDGSANTRRLSQSRSWVRRQVLAQADRMLGEGKDVTDVGRELQVSEQTCYRWRNQFAG